ncbi:hypothetical protein [Streptomyces sp. WMMB 322]|uniref:hypothetical protein n=1 Tax=Streptomyces sp. WMMB 322 TaxID=1286821 RepID=UPI0006E1C078|nr:hypothetical protein [Streptomyces sp. WMMB 322]SCK27623.1 hypothetical protein H180DRAFT_02143 [Streptomyces sp. WMMB 322]
MADDDRYRWLDDEAAERLLRGQVPNARNSRRDGRHRAGHNNVEGAPTSGSGRSSAPAPSWARGGSVPQQRTAEDRLDSFLDALVDEQTATLHALGAARAGRAPGEASAELPGEAAAVAAFRAAQPVMSAGHSGTIDITAGPTEAETVIGRRAARENAGRARDRRPGAARRGTLMGRPLRAGFAMAVAGCALGGAAVAAGAGVLPTPFGGGGSPAASVSPLASPGDERKESAGAGGSPDDSDGPRRGTREGGPSDSPTGEDLAGKERGRDGKSKGRPTGDEDWWSGNGKGLSGADKKAMARALCKAYEDGKLSAHDRVRLELVAGGPEGVKKWCEKYDSGRDGQGSRGADGSGGAGGPDGPGGSTSGDDGGPGDDADEDDGGSTGGETADGGSTGGSRPDDGGGGSEDLEGQSGDSEGGDSEGGDSEGGDSEGFSSPDAEPSPSAEETAPAGAQQ